MARITIDQMPKVARSGRVSKHAAEMAEVEALLGEKDFGKGLAESFTVDKDELPALVSSLRKAAKGKGRKINTVYKDGTVYITDGGDINAESESSKTIKASVATKAK